MMSMELACVRPYVRAYAIIICAFRGYPFFEHACMHVISWAFLLVVKYQCSNSVCLSPNNNHTVCLGRGGQLYRVRRGEAQLQSECDIVRGGLPHSVDFGFPGRIAR